MSSKTISEEELLKEFEDKFCFDDFDTLDFKPVRSLRTNINQTVDIREFISKAFKAGEAQALEWVDLMVVKEASKYIGNPLMPTSEENKNKGMALSKFREQITKLKEELE